ncbi:MAG: hypothetical protein LIO56_03040 [Lachnospiraceae bacterium]|nr:hypothetical protein [Lachnospiraceae bacterium]
MSRRWVIVIVVIILILVIYPISRAIGNRGGTSDLLAGEESSQTDRSTGMVVSVDPEDETMVVEVSAKDSMFDEGDVVLDCEEAEIDLTDFEPGDEVVFYYFLTDIDGNNVAARNVIK